MKLKILIFILCILILFTNILIAEKLQLNGQIFNFRTIELSTIQNVKIGYLKESADFKIKNNIIKLLPDYEIHFSDNLIYGVYIFKNTFNINIKNQQIKIIYYFELSYENNDKNNPYIITTFLSENTEFQIGNYKVLAGKYDPKIQNSGSLLLNSNQEVYALMLAKKQNIEINSRNFNLPTYSAIIFNNQKISGITPGNNYNIVIDNINIFTWNYFYLELNKIRYPIKHANVTYYYQPAILFDENENISKLEIGKDFELRINDNLFKIIYEPGYYWPPDFNRYISFYEDGKVKSIFISEDHNVIINNKKVIIPGNHIIEFDKNGNIINYVKHK